MDGVRYAVRRLPGFGPGQRPPKALESAACRALQSELDPVAPVFSRSHGRGLIAAAVARSPVMRLGIDVEWIDPRRRMADIAELYLREMMHPTPEQFFRGWTFGEAWFKAFGVDPEPDLIWIAGTNQAAEPIRVGEAWLLQDLPEPGFVLSIVWSSNSSSCA